jgi:hypothetical protein
LDHSLRLKPLEVFSSPSTPIFAAGINTFEEHVIAPGWCLALRCRGPQFSAQYINLHLEPALSHADKVKLMRAIADAAAAFSGDTFLMGDLNFVPSDESRFQVAECRDASGDTKLAIEFEALFGDFTELHQAGYTRKQIAHGMISTLSRIDRIYTNIQPCLLHDLCIHTHLSAISPTPTTSATTFRYPRRFRHRVQDRPPATGSELGPLSAPSSWLRQGTC